MAPFATHRITHWRRGLWLTNASWAWCEHLWKARMYQSCKMPLPGNPIHSFLWYLRKMLFFLLSTSWHNIINLYQSVRDLFGWLCRELSIAWEACSFVQPLSSGRWQRATCDYGGVVNVAFWWNMHPILAVYSSMVTEKKDTKILAFDTSRLVQWAMSQKSFRSKRKTCRLSRTKNICCLSSFVPLGCPGPPGPPSSPVLLDFICISSHVFACVWAMYALMYNIIMLYVYMQEMRCHHV